MKNKGFTLIELLAVIVILAIIALIATPIILNIIDDTKESANESSVEMYAKAVENAVAAYMLKFPTDNNVKLYKLYKSYNGERDFIEYDGEDIDCDVYIYSSGKVYITKCSINGQEILAKDSTEENKKYYSVGEETAEAHIGEYVNYVATGTSYTGKWRILGIEDGHILLLSDSVGKLDLQGKEGWTNGPSRMDSMASAYATGTKAISARSINVDDINKVLGFNPYNTADGKIAAEGYALEYGNTITYSYKDGSIYYKASNGLEGKRIGKDYPSFEDFDGTIISAEYPNNTVTHTSTYLYYNIRTLVHETEETGNEEVGAPLGSPIYNMLTTGQIYWLADQSICANESRVSWQLRIMNNHHVDGRPLYHSFDDDDQTLYSFNVRSVVTLDESAKLVYDKANSIWNIE